MLRPKNLWRRFGRSTRGVAAIEFAMIMPVLAVMFLASFDGGRAIAVYMKVRDATYTVNAITNQYQIIHDADMQAILGATTAVLAPYSSSPVGVTVSQIAIDSQRECHDQLEQHARRHCPRGRIHGNCADGA